MPSHHKAITQSDLVNVFKLSKYPLKEEITRKQKILRLYKKCMITASRVTSVKRSRYLMFGPPTNPLYMFRDKRLIWDSPGQPVAIVHELFTQRKVETNPVLSDVYVKEAEDFVLQWSRADPVPYKFNSTNHPLYDRNKAFPKEVCIETLFLYKRYNQCPAT